MSDAQRDNGTLTDDLVLTSSDGVKTFLTGTNETNEKPESLVLTHILNGAVIPAISAFGVVGNLLNLVIMSVRYGKREVDVLERGALAVLIALAMSDMCFCLSTLPYAKFHVVNKAIFYAKDIEFYFKTYGLYFQNVFIKVSTWLTCVVGLARYIGICHPLRARVFISICGIRIAIAVSYVLWFTMMVPLIFNFSVLTIPLTNVSSMYIIDVGPFMTNNVIRTGFSCLWFITGFFIPIVILGFCNSRLICALRQSLRLRKTSSSLSDSLRHQRDVSSRITVTLVALIVTCMLLVSPSEILYFYSEMMASESYESFELAATLANVLQAANVSFHFVLYCCVNATFRRTMIGLAYMLKNIAIGKKPCIISSNPGRLVHRVGTMDASSGSDGCSQKVNTGFSTNATVVETVV